MEPARNIDVASLLPPIFTRWFAQRGWSPRPHQLELLVKARVGRSVLLIAPTGGGKTLAGFLPTLVELSEKMRPRGLRSTGRDISRSQGLHTLYISPLKALAVDIARNLELPVKEMALPVRLETRTGDTPASKRQRQRRDPPDILITTPEQLALLIATADAPYLFGTLKRVVLDELHSLVTSKRGDLLSLGLARLFTLAPQLTVVGLSATVAEPDGLCRFLVPQPRVGQARAELVLAQAGAQAQVTMLETKEYLPWAGHSARHALGEIYDLIKNHKTTLVFVNTRSQAEFMFQELWRVNEDNLAVALHHGSLDVAQRRKVEAAISAGKLRAVVCTSSLDLGVDWGDVDLVIASELMEAGRAIQRGLVTPDRTTLVTSLHRVYSMTERTALGDGRVDAAELIKAARSEARRLVSANFERLAEDARSVIGAVLFGAVAGSGALRYLTSGDFGLGAGLHLPGGARIVSIELDYWDNSTTGRVAAVLEVCNYTGDVCSVAHASCGEAITVCSDYADAPGFSFLVGDLTADNIQVDNYENRYFIVAGNSTSDGSTAISRISIGYKLQVSPGPATATFTDVPTTHPFFKFVEALHAAGITNGYPDGRFGVNDPITRGQMAVYLSAALGLNWP